VLCTADFQAYPILCNFCSQLCDPLLSSLVGLTETGFSSWSCLEAVCINVLVAASRKIVRRGWTSPVPIARPLIRRVSCSVAAALTCTSHDLVPWRTISTSTLRYVARISIIAATVSVQGSTLSRDPPAVVRSQNSSKAILKIPILAILRRQGEHHFAVFLHWDAIDSGLSVMLSRVTWVSATIYIQETRSRISLHRCRLSKLWFLGRWLRFLWSALGIHSSDAPASALAVSSLLNPSLLSEVFGTFFG
jgi:hypothetical protein